MLLLLKAIIQFTENTFFGISTCLMILFALIGITFH